MADETNSTAQGAAETTAQGNAGSGTQTTATTGESTQQQTTSLDNLESLIQRAVDRATNKLGNENKKLRGELETLKKAKLSDDEVKALEMQEKEKDIADREKKLKDRENRLLAIKAIKEVGLDDGSDASLAIVDFVMADDEAAIKERVKAFDALVKRIVQSQVDKVFKSNGRTPGVGSGNAADTSGKTDNIGARIGQNAAKANKAAQTTLDFYIGGKKK